MAWTDFLTNHTTLVAFVLIGSFVLWKFVLQPISNEGKSLDPTEEEVKGFEMNPVEDLKI